MQTDISLESSQRKIIDTKYYSETLNNRFSEKFHSKDLYQLYAYLINIENINSGKHNISCDGILIYPTVSKEVDQFFLMAGHNLSIVTVDLSKPWNEIHIRLIEIIKRFAVRPCI